jgi:hypothetical protein
MIPINRKIRLTIIQLTQIHISPIATFFIAVFPDLNFASLPAAVSIWNHPYNTTMRATNAAIHRAQFIKFWRYFNVFSVADSCVSNGSHELEIFLIVCLFVFTAV